MPPGAYALVALFALISGIAGALAARIAGPRRLWAMAAPALAAFGALYLVGHRFGIGIGPEVEMLGFRVSLAFDVLVGFGTAVAAAAVQRAVLGLLQPQERGPRRNGAA